MNNSVVLRTHSVSASQHDHLIFLIYCVHKYHNLYHLFFFKEYSYTMENKNVPCQIARFHKKNKVVYAYKINEPHSVNKSKLIEL